MWKDTEWSIKYPCYLEISPTGRLGRLVHKNQKVVAEFLISGSLESTAYDIHLGKLVDPFQAELIQLCEYENINIAKETIGLKETK